MFPSPHLGPALLAATLLALGCAGPPDSIGPHGGHEPAPDGELFRPPDGRTDPPWPADAPLPPEFDFPPWLTMPAPSRIVVGWRTVDVSSGVVEFGPIGGDTATVVSADLANLHHADLGALTPNTAYAYRVAIDGTDAERRGVFVTPGGSDWRFAHIAEFHAPTNSPQVAKFAEAIRTFRPHVVVESGDMVDTGTEMADWRSYMQTSAPWISNVILLPNHSNHANGFQGNALLKDWFVLPNNERWYPTRFGQVQFITLDSTYDRVENQDLIDEPAAIVSWLDQARASDVPPQFVVAAWHYPACSSSYSSRAASRAWVTENFIDAFRANGGVDLVLVGHDKYYERSSLEGGIVHLQTNAGRLAPSTEGDNHDGCTPVVTNTATRSMAFIRAHNGTLSATVLDEDGELLDLFTIER